MTEEIKTKYGIDTTDFRAGISQINRDIRVIESEFRASAAALGDWGSTATGLESRIKALTEEIGLQQVKVESLRGEYERVVAEKGANSRAAEELAIKLNKETETLNKMQGELDTTSGNLEELGNKSDEAGQEMEETANQGIRLGDVLSGIGAGVGIAVSAIAALAAAALAAAGAMTALVLSSAEMAGELVDTSAKTGISVERLQVLSYQADQLGVSTETVTGALAKLTRNMDAARDGSEKQSEAFDALGITLTDSNGNLRDSEAVMGDVFAALNRMESGAERDALAMDIFGKSAMELNPLIQTSAYEMAMMEERAREVGAVVSTETVGALEEWGDTLATLEAGLKGTGAEIAGALLPAFTAITDQAEEYLGEFASIVRDADGDLSQMADGIGQLLGRIATDLAQQGPKMLTAGLGIIQGVVNAILQALPELIPAAVSMITSLVQFLVENLPMLIDAGIQLVLALVNGILPMLPMLIEAAIQIIVTLATGIGEALPQLIPAIVAIIPQIILVLIENLPLLVSAALQLILALATGLIEAIPILIPYIPEIIIAIYNALVEAFPMIIQAAQELNTTLSTAMMDFLAPIIAAAKELINTISNTISSVMGQVMEMGTAIVKAVWAGINAAKDWFYRMVTQFFRDLVEAAKAAIGMHSPPKAFWDIGSAMALALGSGFESSFRGIERDIAGAVGGLGGLEAGININGGFGGGAAGAGAAAPIVVNLYANINNEMDIYDLTQRVAEVIVGAR